MKKIYIVRHAKSSWDNPGLDDHERPLDERGLRDAPEMGRRLKKLGILPNLMLSSPAVRAFNTCREFAKSLGYPKERIITDKRLYHADPEQILHVITELKNDPALQLMIFGHNPGLTEFANQLFNDAIDNIPTCGIVSGELSIRYWGEVTWGCGQTGSFDFPKKKSKGGG